MRHSLKATFLTAALLLPRAGDAATLPWKQAGLTEREAAAHLLNRFAYGPRPGEVDAVVKMGLDKWLDQQLAGLPDAALEKRLEGRLPSLTMSTRELAETYPPVGAVLREARQAGILPENLDPAELANGEDKKGRRAEVIRFAREQGYRPQRELVGHLMAAKLVRAVSSGSQLAEVMTDFWFNHFNVSATDHQSRLWLLPYERDAIRPNALGRFRDLLGATARHPAMLYYLDNAQSSAAMDDLKKRRPLRPRGLNENYARELLELHTLGVDGGYTQQDVVEVARVFTGWTAIPPRLRGDADRRLARMKRRAGAPGFHAEGDFVFRADFHDAGAKTLLGTRFPEGGGMEEGEKVLDLLARHPKTAEHIAGKLAARFVSDHPPKPLVDRLARVYLETGGDVRRMIAALAGSPEFWSRDAVGAKIKSPFELTASALRTLDARVTDPRETLRWIARMGQPLYAYQAPTGYPDRATAWVNTGSLLSRMNFGLELAAGRIRGVDFDLPALSGGREPESRDDALKIYAGLLMPGRDLSSTLKLLGPVASAPDLAKKVDKAAPREKPSKDEEDVLYGDPEIQGTTRSVIVSDRLRPSEPEDPTPLEQVVGVLLGSPEFQRR